jgi:hypothetical protein
MKQYRVLGPAIVIAWAVLQPAPLQAQTAADSVAIRQTALNYIEGWYAADAERMARALHPELAKRIVNSTPGAESRLGHMTSAELVNATRNKAAGAQGRKEVRILDTFGNTASVRVDADTWVDYLHLAKWNGEWKIVNVLWEMRRR